MSCVVGYVEDGIVYMGGDSACINTENLDVRIRNDPKVFIKDNMLLGYVGSYRVGQVLRYSFNIPKKPIDDKSDFEYMCSTFIPEFINALKLNDCYQYKNEGEFCFEGEIMVGLNGNIYIIGSDLQVIREEGKFSCIGCAEDYAVGSLFIIEKLFPNITPREKIEYALETSETFNAAVRRPFLIYSSLQLTMKKRNRI